MATDNPTLYFPPAHENPLSHPVTPYSSISTTVLTMAGSIRQSIDIKALESYIREHVAVIQTPIAVSQVCISC